MHNGFQDFSNHSNMSLMVHPLSAVTKFNEQCYNRQDIRELEKW